ncbi:hypothetical protein CDAR_125261 [Caerostris darwini]|uniref:Uncharacterized protein n=1 Tax=Caerostris darwini TaxID=1538125 RepID=A0AAV4S1I2_9ARAC|nr:hypothetical protein CDAR_125261 [Caerostris darwini]
MTLMRIQYGRIREQGVEEWEHEVAMSQENALFNTSNYPITDELAGTAEEAKRDCDSSHVTWKSDLDIMSLKGKIQWRFDLVIGSTPGYFRQIPHLRTPTSHRRCAPYFVWEKQAHYLRCLPI